MKALEIVGHKNSGKTTLVEYFVERFSRDGFRVAAVKHIHHQFTIDTENKDTWRMARRGAWLVASVSPNETAVMFHAMNEWENSLNRLQRIMYDEKVDVAVFEGFHMVLGGREDVYKIITVKNSHEIAFFLNSLKPPILAVVNISGEIVQNLPVPLYVPPLSEELYLHTRRGLQLV
ncbi:MAG: molybdopterin-guanine dinucleotide biosynthesis protein B [Candidatus Caldarchaeum sp.]|nr:molybdopterin-guanine dinucleotide biosynthesis protein B [Candidatus Caldarchaeum sp.]MCS7138072.1 molybdopterin-guanine dinucleotide biosynthesis protein B [Candidatus Caldarchaeum sp.]MDW7978669.1 molybdopterin-guanine dinucleotide biosynthesis protein B [Candidatus Caldarchaeum sp.]MDW8359648.1 molybdopterin-guanine dinucleotide biosynthesis protein B [Candidatus Caldarchaeum sp.]